MICVFGLAMAVFACIWNAIGIDLGWLFLVMGLLIGGAVFPVAFAITWKGQTKAGALSGALSGLAAGLIAWLTTAKQYYGTLTVATTGLEYPTLAGNLAAIMTGLIVSASVSILFKGNHSFDWEVTRSINMTADAPHAALKPASAPSPAINDHDAENEAATVKDAELEEEPAKLRSAFKLACIGAFVITFIMDFLLPMPMFFSHYIFSKGFFTAWVVISFIWVFTSTAISVVLPIVETMGFFGELVTNIRHDLGGGKKRNKKDVFEGVDTPESDGAASPVVEGEKKT